MSNDHVLKTIEQVKGEITELDAQLAAKKRLANDLCRMARVPPIYGDADLETSAASTSTRPDEYYGKPMATVVRAILAKRQAAQLGAATPNEIYEEMKAGGYHFQAKNEDNAKRGLYTSLGKNTSTFHKLPNGTYGLKEWYPDVPKNKENGNKDNGGGKADEKPLHEELQEESSEESTDGAKAPSSAK